MGVEPLALACQLEEFKKLDNLPFYKQANGYTDEILKGLPNYVIPTYLYLREQSFKNYKRRGVVAQSNGKIAKGAKRSTRTIQRHVSILQELGYIRFIETHRGKYRVNYIEVTCPQAVLERLLSTNKQINCIKKDTTRMSYCHDTGVIHNNRYIDPPIIKTNIREESRLKNLEPVFKAVEPSDIFLNVSRETSTLPTTTEIPHGTSPIPIAPVQGSQLQAEVAGFITKDERKEITKKLKAMKRDGEIHPKVQANYQDILVLVQHVIVHCLYRNVFKKTFKHALNSAAKGIRNGTWTTPKRVIAVETAERERLANEAKERERRECLGSVGHIFGEALRLQNRLSEVDIAKAKADILERGINSLGRNATNENIARLKALIQKTVEDKQKERWTAENSCF